MYCEVCEQVRCANQDGSDRDQDRLNVDQNGQTCEINAFRARTNQPLDPTECSVSVETKYERPGVHSARPGQDVHSWLFRL